VFIAGYRPHRRVFVGAIEAGRINTEELNPRRLDTVLAARQLT